MEMDRDYCFDNLKLMLIFLVVFGHSIEPYIEINTALMSIYNFIYLFHMPLFVFISGYFSKNIERCRNNAFSSLLVPYFIANILYYFLSLFLSGTTEPISTFLLSIILYPAWTFWYLISLFYWRKLLIVFVKIKYILPISIFSGLIIGLLSNQNIIDCLSLGRAISFLPFFLAGYYTTQFQINKIRSLNKTLPFLIISIIFISTVILSIYFPNYYNFLYLSKPYSYFHIDIFTGMLLRFIVYIISFLISLCIINIMANKKFNFTELGKNTMPVYLGHGYIILILKTVMPEFNFLTLILPIFIVLILSHPKVSIFYTKFINFVNYKIFRLKPYKQTP